MPMTPKDPFVNGDVAPQRSLSLHHDRVESQRAKSNLHDTFAGAIVKASLPSQISITHSTKDNPVTLPTNSKDVFESSEPEKQYLFSTAVAKTPKAATVNTVRTVEDLQAEIRKLHEQKIELIGKLAESHKNDCKKTIEEECNQLKAILQSKAQQIELISNEKDDLVKQIAKAQAAHIDEVAQLKTIIEEIRSSKTFQSKSLDVSIDTFGQDTRDAVNNDFDNLKSKLSKAEMRLELAITENERLKQDFEMKVSEKDGEIKSLCNVRSELINENTRLKNSLFEIEISKENAVSAESLIIELDAASADLKRFKEEVSRLKMENRQLEEKFNLQIGRLSQNLHAKDKRIEELEISFERLRDRDHLANTLLESTNSRVKDHLVRIRDLQTAYINLQRTYEDLKRAKKKEEIYFMDELSKLKSLSSQMHGDTFLFEENTALKAKLELYKQQLEEMNSRTQSSLSSMQALEQAISRISELENALKVYETENQALAAELGDSKSEIQILKNSKTGKLPYDPIEKGNGLNRGQYIASGPEKTFDPFIQRDQILKRVLRLKNSFKIMGEIALFDSTCQVEQIMHGE